MGGLGWGCEVEEEMNDSQDFSEETWTSRQGELNR